MSHAMNMARQTCIVRLHMCCGTKKTMRKSASVRSVSVPEALSKVLYLSAGIAADYAGSQILHERGCD